MARRGNLPWWVGPLAWALGYSLALQVAGLVADSFDAPVSVPAATLAVGALALACAARRGRSHAYGFSLRETMRLRGRRLVCALLCLAILLILPLGNALEAGAIPPHALGSASASAFAALCAALPEELFFRGYLPVRIREGLQLPEPAAILLANALFALAHAGSALTYGAGFALMQMGITLFAGLALASLRALAGTVYPGVFVHFLINAASAGAMVYSMQGLGRILALSVLCAGAAFLAQRRSRSE